MKTRKNILNETSGTALYDPNSKIGKFLRKLFFWLRRYAISEGKSFQPFEKDVPSSYFEYNGFTGISPLFVKIVTSEEFKQIIKNEKTGAFYKNQIICMPEESFWNDAVGLEYFSHECIHHFQNGNHLDSRQKGKSEVKSFLDFVNAKETIVSIFSNTKMEITLDELKVFSKFTYLVDSKNEIDAYSGSASLDALKDIRKDSEKTYLSLKQDFVNQKNLCKLVPIFAIWYFLRRRFTNHIFTSRCLDMPYLKQFFDSCIKSSLRTFSQMYRQLDEESYVILLSLYLNNVKIKSEDGKKFDSMFLETLHQDFSNWVEKSYSKQKKKYNKLLGYLGYFNNKNKNITETYNFLKESYES